MLESKEKIGSNYKKFSKIIELKIGKKMPYIVLYFKVV